MAQADDMSGKVCIVTGANSGIGKATALGLARLGATVVMVCRDRQRGEAARQEIQHKTGNTHIDLLLADLSSMQAVRTLADQIKQTYSQVHVLINNAGGVFMSRRLSVDGLEMTLAVNYFSAFLLTNLLLDTLKASAPARIITVSSIAHVGSQLDPDDLQLAKHYRPLSAYGTAKLAAVLFTYALARHLEGTGVTANCLHPGVVATNIWVQPLPRFLHPLSAVSRLFGVSPEQGARTSLYLATSPDVAQITGKYFDNGKEQQTSHATHDIELQDRLWQKSAELTGL